MKSFSLTECVLKVTGPQAEDLLQGQLTIDVTRLSRREGNLAAICDAKGRVLSLFYICYFNEAYYLILSAPLLELTYKILAKYAVFYKTTLQKNPEEVNILGLTVSANNLEEVRKDFSICFIQLNLQSSRRICLGEQSMIAQLKKASNSSENLMQWKQENILEKIPEIYLETSGLLLPHDLGLPALGAVDFNKGCYTGQEIIARMQYRGKLKNNLYRASLKRTIVPKIGMEVFYQADEKRKAGLLIDACEFSTAHFETFLVLENNHAKDQHLFLEDDPENYFVLSSSPNEDTPC